MLLRFEVGNHRSIFEPVELSMIAMDKDRAAAREIEGLDEKVLAVAGIYGANASGKTNLIDALSWLSLAFDRSLVTWENAIPCDPFSFATGPPQPSYYGIELVVSGVRYRYELEVEKSQVVFEALYSYPQQRRRTLFEREAGSDPAFRRGTRFTGGGRELITPTTLVMSVASRLTKEIDSVARRVRDISYGFWPRALISKEARLYRPNIRWARRGWDDALIDVFDDASSRPDPDSGTSEGESPWKKRDLALEMLMFADLGVKGVEVVDESPGLGRGGRRLRLLHDVAGDPRPLELGDESDGTLTWLGLIPELLTVLEQGGLFVVDELDTSLHPLISGNLVELFQDPVTNDRGAQIIFTTHDTSLLGRLSRDEVLAHLQGARRQYGTNRAVGLSQYQRSAFHEPRTRLPAGSLRGRPNSGPVPGSRGSGRREPQLSMAPRRRGQRPLRRRAPQIDERARFVIFCEGELTEPLYLEALAALHEVRSVATLDIRGMGCEPRKLVEEAKAEKRSERRQWTGATEYWCVFDVEAPAPHKRLHEAVQMARDNGISVAVSNPCFELWLVLHYADHERWIDNDDCGSLRRQHDGSQGKRLDGAAYMPLRREAIMRARRLAMLHDSANRVLPDNNPSSGMYRLLEAIEPVEDQQ